MMSSATQIKLPLMIKGSETSSKNKINAIIAMSRFVIIGLLFVLVSCRSSFIASSEAISRDRGNKTDSTVTTENVKLDTFKVAASIVSVDIPTAVLKSPIDHSADSITINSIVKHHGHATLQVTRTSKGITVIAGCDSLMAILMAKEKVIFRLKSINDSISHTSNVSSSKVTIVPKIPAWIIITAVISLVINLALIYFFVLPKIKSFLP
jgi:hypothetical protein